MHPIPAIAMVIVLTLPLASPGQSPTEETAPKPSGEANAFDELPDTGDGGMEMLGEMVVESSKLDETLAETQIQSAGWMPGGPRMRRSAI